MMAIGDLCRLAKSTFIWVKEQFPDSLIIWSQILHRLHYRYSANTKAIERARPKLNGICAKAVLGFGGAYIKHPNIKAKYPELFYDGIHLSETGNDIFINGLQGGLEWVLSKGGLEWVLSKGGKVFPPES
ncbi:hypothetical protein KP79_PYT07809 [Mizuhopecten yessoensis]|uniref:SGNH hydrolase-type esterase domain-containing protein n=1 Tax=Mizuhopecten yessoensis TaxID=6573 RepID=A0A210Q8I5_MIZYE|nr:hypothetical protein KP79_PYT07809 [Mizuhopecten yessoensis]